MKERTSYPLSIQIGLFLFFLLLITGIYFLNSGNYIPFLCWMAYTITFTFFIRYWTKSLEKQNDLFDSYENLLREEIGLSLNNAPEFNYLFTLRDQGETFHSLIGYVKLNKGKLPMADLRFNVLSDMERMEKLSLPSPDDKCYIFGYHAKAYVDGLLDQVALDLKDIPGFKNKVE